MLVGVVKETRDRKMRIKATGDGWQIFVFFRLETEVIALDSDLLVACFLYDFPHHTFYIYLNFISIPKKRKSSHHQK